MAHELSTTPTPRVGLLVLVALLLAGCETSPTLPPPPAQAESDTRPLSVVPKAVPAVPEHVAEEVEKKPVVDESNIYFSSGSTRVDAVGEQKLRVHASRLAGNRKTVVTLIGLTDDQGSRSLNLVLAEQRIEAVAKVLRAHGVRKNQIRPYARGNKKPDSSCETPACREKMRRVELEYEAK